MMVEQAIKSAMSQTPERGVKTALQATVGFCIDAVRKTTCQKTGLVGCGSMEQENRFE